jgi:hypothetical protein
METLLNKREWIRLNNFREVMWTTYSQQTLWLVVSISLMLKQLSISVSPMSPNATCIVSVVQPVLAPMVSV